MTDKEINDKIVNTILTMINLMTEDQKLFIKRNILFSGEDWPVDYKREIYNSELSWPQLRKIYGKEFGWVFIENEYGERSRIVPEIEPIPKGWHLLKNYSET